MIWLRPASLAPVLCASLLFSLAHTGCGVPPDEHAAVVAETEALRLQLDELRTSLSAATEERAGCFERVAVLEGNVSALDECQSARRDCAQRLGLYRTERGIDADNVNTMEDEYAQQLEIDVTARVIDTYLEEDVPAVRFRIRNSGERTLTYLKLRLTWLDAAGQPIGESTSLVLWADGSFGSLSEDTPLRPGYVFTYPRRGSSWHTNAELPGEDFRGGSVRVTAEEMRFEDE